MVTIPQLHLGGLALGPFPIRWYALAYIAGILLGWRYCIGLVRNAKLWGGRPPTATPAQIDDLVLWLTLAIIVGGRMGYICFYMLVSPDQRADLLAQPWQVFEVWQGGMSFHGAAIGVGVAMAGFWLANFWRGSLWATLANWATLLGIADLVAACEPIGQCFGRLANFINGELWGRTTDVPWAMVFCNGRLAQENGGYCPAGHVPRHPSQLYEAALEGVVLFLVLRFVTHRLKWLQRPGACVGVWLIGYGAIRIALENVRNPDIGMPTFPLGLTMGMMLSIPMILLGAVALWLAFRKPLPPPAPAEPEPA
ncbi:MAG TPA: prolipoprotein diacylglyceryl transferase [Caulobacteraceae bacterium]